MLGFLGGNMSLRIESVWKSKQKKEIKKMYFEAFEKSDRMPFGMMQFMCFLGTTKFLAFYDEDVLCGFAYFAKLGKTIFVMFFAVNKKFRSMGYGSRILENIQNRFPKKKIVVSIEPVVLDAEDFEENSKRKSFYLKNGFMETGYFIKLGKKQEILIKNGEFKKWKFRLFLMLYSNFTLYPKIWKK